MSSLFLDALQCQNFDRPPVWLMRQAGRYLPEYAALRQKHSLWQMFHEPELACRTTLMPIQRFGVDAAILFSDILVIVEALGLELAFPEGFGPVVVPCLETASDVDALPMLSAQEVLPYVKKTVHLIKESTSVPLIGFCGGPFTVASYMIDRENKGNLQKTKTWIYQDPESFHRLLKKITTVTIEYLEMQISVGADAIQIFDSWAGVLTRDSFQEFSLQYVKEIAQALGKRVPLIFFCRGSGLFAKELSESGANALSFDWQMDLCSLRKVVPSHIAVQGNLDPHVLFGRQDVLKKEVLRILNSMKDEPGFIFNLGHGVLPETPVENVALLIETVKSYQVAAGGMEQRIASVFPPD